MLTDRQPVTQNGVFQVNPAAGVGQYFNMTLYDVLNYGYDIGLAAYPIWREDARQDLNDMIVNQFMWREIRGETPRQFIWFLNRTMNLRMPELNPVFELLENTTYEDLWVTERFKSRRDNHTDNVIDAKAQAYTSTNPKETMVGKDPTEYYDAGQFNKNDQDTDNTFWEDYNHERQGLNLSQALSLWANSPNNPLATLFTYLEPCFAQIIRPNCNVW